MRESHPKKRSYNTRLIKQNYSYFIDEITSLFGIHKKTVSHWVKIGLRVTEYKKPYLIYGNDLIEFIKKQKQSRKKSCQLHEIYCVKCHDVRLPWGNLADLLVNNNKSPRLVSVCPVCGNEISKLVSKKNVPDLSKILCLKTIHQERLTDCSSPSVNLP